MDYRLEMTRTKQIISSAFEAAIRMECDMRITENQINYYYFPGSGTADEAPLIIESENGQQVIGKMEEWDSFTKAEKEYNLLQSILLKYHPVSVSVIDSLWQTLLTRQNINVETGVIFTNHQTMVSQHYSRLKDYAFYASAYAMEKCTMGILKEIGLQGFVRFKPRLVFRPLSIHFILWIVFCFFAALFFLVYFFRKTEKTETKPYRQMLVWDEKNQTLCYEDINIPLSTELGKLFDLLWKNQNQYVTYEELNRSLYSDKVDNSKERLAQTVKRLRNSLDVVIPDIINIENRAGRGYRLNVYCNKG
jgi:DNA-binding winged helix-turn-helix (wHTH) protein